MAANDIKAALARVQAVLERKPEVGVHDDAPATSRWVGGLRATAHHANGTQLPTDMPSELGGSGDHVTPGWLFRAGLASCATTSLVLSAAAQGLELAKVEVKASSRSDTRGLMRMNDEAGQPVGAGPLEIVLDIHIAAPGMEATRLQAFVEEALRHSPIPCAVGAPMRLVVHVEGQA